MEAAEEYLRSAGSAHFTADPLGSYTGIAVEGTPFAPPELVFPDAADARPPAYPHAGEFPNVPGALFPDRDFTPTQDADDL